MTQQNQIHRFLADFQLSKPTTTGERTFSGVAYAGGVITDHSWYSAVAFDLATTQAETPLPLLFNHHGSPIGVIETVNIGTQIEIAGRLFADIDDVAKDIAAKADRGIKWQLSVGIFPTSTEKLNGSQTHNINGQSFVGELALLKNNRIREVSFVTMGADDKTSATVFNSSPKPQQKDSKMALTPEQITALQDENKALKTQCADMQDENKALKTQCDDMQAQLDELKITQKKQVKASREAELKNIFSALGREYKTESVSVYFDLTDEQFAAVTGDLSMQAGAHKPQLPAQLPAHLFNTQATDGADKPNEPAINTSAIYHQMNARGSN
jgi:hypothetical protein